MNLCWISKDYFEFTVRYSYHTVTINYIYILQKQFNKDFLFQNKSFDQYIEVVTTFPR